MNAPIRKPVFDAVRALRRKGFDPAEVAVLDAALDTLAVPRDATVASEAPAWRPGVISERIQLEILEHEGIVPEAYKDSKGIWTWGGGVTDASGHKVARYKDAPVSITRCLEVYEWLLRKAYLPDVLDAFKGMTLSEAQLGAALSFHWNTGAIREATWVRDVRAGRMAQGRLSIMNWSTPKEIIARRQAERNLFFDGTWSSDGIITVYSRVIKPGYQPDWRSAMQVDIRPMLRDVVARAGD